MNKVGAALCGYRQLEPLSGYLGVPAVLESTNQRRFETYRFQRQDQILRVYE